MLEIHFHERGEQGAVTSAELLEQAALKEEKYFQFFSFGPERRGAPVISFCRISHLPIRLRTGINAPDIIIVQDPSLLKTINVTEGLKPNGLLIINSKKNPEHFASIHKIQRIATVDATSIAFQILGHPITNTVLLGALIKAAGLVELSSITAAIQDRFDPEIAALNIQALQQAYQETRVLNRCDFISNKTSLAVEAFSATKDETEGKPDYLEAPFHWSAFKPVLAVLAIDIPGNSKPYFTGSLRTFYPQLTKERCIKCGVCWILCPDASYIQNEEGYYLADLNYCRGCGICAYECPTGAITMLQEMEAEV